MSEPTTVPPPRGIQLWPVKAPTSGDTTCSICHEDWNAQSCGSEQVVVTACDHHFHLTCMWQWFDTDATTCPYCREDLSQPIDVVPVEDYTPEAGVAALNHLRSKHTVMQGYARRAFRRFQRKGPVEGLDTLRQVLYGAASEYEKHALSRSRKAIQMAPNYPSLVMGRDLLRLIDDEGREDLDTSEIRNLVFYLGELQGSL